MAAGIIINPYQYTFRLEYDWYEQWDISSSCIWDFSVIKNMTLTHTFKVTKNEKILYNKLKNNENIEIEILTKK